MGQGLLLQGAVVRVLNGFRGFDWCKSGGSVEMKATQSRSVGRECAFRSFDAADKNRSSNHTTHLVALGLELLRLQPRARGFERRQQRVPLPLRPRHRPARACRQLQLLDARGERLLWFWVWGGSWKWVLKAGRGGMGASRRVRTSMRWSREASMCLIYDGVMV